MRLPEKEERARNPDRAMTETRGERADASSADVRSPEGRADGTHDSLA